jgi:DNA polymerase I-like protein with 3'-5' exonuclease and polymerase domains
MIDLNADISQLQVLDPITELKFVEVGKFPNQRCLIIPDDGKTIIDMDLDRADAQFVAWEANDSTLKDILKAGADLHLENAKSIWGAQCKKEGPERKLAKRFCHAVNYGAYPKKLAKSLGITVKTAEWIYNRWFQIHPGIREWHNRVKAQLFSERLVRNPFGYERYYFDRPENVINEALAWCPQSSVGIIINTAWDAIDAQLPEVEVLMQVHDSLTMQCPSRLTRELLPRIQEKSLIAVPYDDPLIIPVGFKISDKSWGHVVDPCEDGKDLELAGWLAQGLHHAKEAASSRLAR